MPASTHPGQYISYSPATSALPSELWCHIFSFATGFPARTKLYDSEHSPFQEHSDEAHLPHIEESLKVGYALIRVCRWFRDLAIECLYENVRIRYGALGLRRSLQRSREGLGTEGYGRYVRRITLSSTRFDLDTDILKRCPNLEVIVRPKPRKDDSFFVSASLPDPTSAPLKFVKRIEWWCDGLNHPRESLSFLRRLLQLTPNLRYLSLCGNPSMTITDDMLMKGFDLPPITTLRLESQSTDKHFMNAVFKHWDLHHLTHLTTNAPPLSRGFSSCGKTIRVLELLPDDKVLAEEILARIISHCPQLQELCYHIEFTAPSVVTHPNISCIRLHARRNPLLPLTFADRERESWSHTVGHFKSFAGSLFPALERVVLYGDWHTILDDARFVPLRQGLRDRSCALELWDGTPVA